MPHVSRVFAFVLLAGLVACESHDIIGVGGQNRATVRVVNATSAALDVVTNGIVSSGNGALAYGTSSTCISVDPTAPNLVLRPTGSTTPITGTLPTLATGGTYVVIAYPGLSSAATFATLSGTFTPTSGRSGLRVFDAVQTSTNYDVYVTAPGAALGTPVFTNLGFSFSTPFFETDAGVRQIRFTDVNTQNVAIDAGTQTLVANKNAMLVLALPTTFLVATCP
jgi:hypothetical protein